ncbi:helix-turn-helix transcriptional regulator [Acidithiobacillus sp. CV18-2]|uniref:Helix-turn-helix transcriptional regulator n=1 Tax=Igneacidithiobacillus copahuensis TaxID=2724909 RepID=A0AAE3CKX6_9PROT|nr:helix-turn-helix transcriptional regulator [Igneacidithiobacillus copahuensis]MBU2753201.1 helix-turn-helix transcriptional regulator [Acidithiobacillus sp. CV18-3]MBU2758501.1 helix-turn-helix transcriptional regulator [Acidithiobacillus sp. BN09-2]MBU2777610.1 helix-turn-helix transcriptional regulator [Acidithiobacillus sp. CV18-2]MBU2797704.1 helix-turn-helix transcriptional regulator [Acidithiobacillus sp. VAN18-2]MBU2798286.1 helix-turn-helix transcriptional regulator [Acidithiobacill
MSNLIRLIQPVSALRLGEISIPNTERDLVAPRGWQYFPQPVAIPKEWGLQRVLVYRYLRGRDRSWELYPWWRYPKARWPRLPEARSVLRSCLVADDVKEEPIAIGSGRHLCLRQSANGLYFLFFDLTLADAASSDVLDVILNDLTETLPVQVPFFPPILAPEKQLLRLFMQGMSSVEIAQVLSTEPQKINKSIRRITRLFGAVDRDELLVCLWQAYRKNKAWFYEENYE